MPVPTVNLVIPRALAEDVSRDVSPRLESVSGVPVAFLDNTKHNADRLLGELSRLLETQHAIVPGGRYRKKLTSSLPFDEEVYQEVATHYKAAITCIGD